MPWEKKKLIHCPACGKSAEYRDPDDPPVFGHPDDVVVKCEYCGYVELRPANLAEWPTRYGYWEIWRKHESPQM